ncbi:uncharacterized protein LOC21411224 [Morus notabilis]|uniref:uncharacterized protein LOC21411224 n=1 Tax=Morus notabilis TaxID=981085 RepID=UPI000CED72D9|nr:uncharacterized protein LOC21411224 [Morus notabilis]XP_024023366.1 uncharacterized protein LOC21411224 [Morus notabilis]
MAVISEAMAAAAYLSSDRVRRPMHNSSLRGMDKVNELLANSNETAMFNKVRMGPRDYMILCEMLTEKGETISRRFNEVLDAICALHDDFIKPPNYDKVPEFLRANRQRYSTWFDDCVGAIDGTHVPCTPIGVHNPAGCELSDHIGSLFI